MTTNDIDTIRKHPDRSIDDKFERVVAERDDLAGALVETERERDRAEAKVAELTAERNLLAQQFQQAETDAARLAAEPAKARKDRDEYAEDNTRVGVALIDVQRKLAGLEADHRSAVQANTAYANENARLRSQLAEADLAISSMRAAIDEADDDGDDGGCRHCGYGCNDNLTGVTR